MKERIKDTFILIRMTLRNFLLILLGVPCWLNFKTLRMELIAWALCRKSDRYYIGNLFFHKQGLLKTHCYGETPLITLKRIAKRTGVNNQSRILDMGCGAGRASAWLAIKYQCHVTGVDQNPEFIRLAQRLSAGCRMTERLSYIKDDMLTYSKQNVDMIYIYHSALDDLTIEKMAKHLQTCDTHVKIVTVSYALNDILPGSFEIEAQFDGWFPWGLAWIYIQRPVASPS